MRGFLAVAVLSAVVAGCTAPPDPSERSVAGAMRRFESCEDVLAYLKQEALEVVYHGGLPAYAHPAVLIPPNPLAAQEAQDRVALDGERILTLSGRGLQYIRVDGRHPRVAGVLDLHLRSGGRSADPREGQVLVDGDRVAVLTNDGIRLVDVGDPARMRLMSFVQGVKYVRDARFVRGKLRVVTVQSIGPPLPYDQNKTNEQRLSVNRDVIRRSGLTDWFPRFRAARTGHRSVGGRLTPCSTLYAPPQISGLDLVSVAWIDPQDPVPRTALSVLAHAHMFHVSSRRLVVGTQSLPPDWRTSTHPSTTGIHEFDVSDPDTHRYLASGSLPRPGFEPHPAGWPTIADSPDGLRVVATPHGDSGLDLPYDLYVLRLRRKEGQLRAVGSTPLPNVGGLKFVGDYALVLRSGRTGSELALIDLEGEGAGRVVGRTQAPPGPMSALGSQRYIGVTDVDPVSDRSPIPPPRLRYFFVDVSDPTRPRVDLGEHIDLGSAPGYAVSLSPIAGTDLVLVRSSSGLQAFRVRGSNLRRIGVLPSGAFDAFASRGTLYAVTGKGIFAHDPRTLAELNFTEFG